MISASDRPPPGQLLTTTHGDLDCLGTIDQVSLPALIEAKERSARPKDMAVLPVLRATFNETKRRP